MKYIKSFLFFVMAAAFTLAGCNDQDDLQDEVDALGNRVTALEGQVKILNENLETLGTLLNMENMKTIKNVQTGNGQYTITLSDNTVLSLTIGVQGTAQEPEITIEDGKWVVNGKPTDVSAVGQAGANGSGYPEFRVNDGMWEVRFVDASGTPGDWQDVEGDANTGIGEIGDQIIAGVEVTDTQLTITYYTDYSEGTTETISLPIVPDLTCEIVTGDLLDDEDYLLMEAGTVQTLSVNISGGTPQLTYPSEWRATIESTDTEGVYELAIYAPDDDASAASAGSRVSANNMEDVTVQIGSSEPVEPTYNSVYEKYLAEGITIGSYTLNKESGITVTEVTSDQTISGDNSGAYFINEGVTLTLSSANIKDNLILISNSINGGKAKVTASNTFNAATETNFIAQGIEFTRKGILMQIASGKDVNNFILDNCKVAVNMQSQPGAENPNMCNLFNAHNAGDNSVDNIELLNNDIAFEPTSDMPGGGRILNFNAKKVSATITVKNNVFYSTSNQYSLNGTVCATSADLTRSVNVENNTFVNYLPVGQNMIRGVMTAQTIVTVKNNLFWTNVGSDRNVALINAVGGKGDATEAFISSSSVFENTKWYNDGEKKVTFTVWSGRIPSPFAVDPIDEEPTNPFSSMDFANGTFTKASGYENCGATR